MKVFQSIAPIPTRALLLAASALGALSFPCTLLRRAFSDRGLMALSAVFEWGGMVGFLVAYVLLWALLAAAPFRPRDRFTLQGDRATRAANVLLALAALALIHLWLAFAVATAGS